MIMDYIILYIYIVELVPVCFFPVPPGPRLLSTVGDLRFPLLQGGVQREVVGFGLHFFNGKTMGKPWENHGKTWIYNGKTMGKPYFMGKPPNKMCGW